MGIFDFMKTVKPSYSDKVWKKRPEAIKGMITEAMMAITQNQVPVVLGCFEDTITEVMVFLTSASVPNFYLNTDSFGDASNQSKVVFVCHTAHILSSSGLTGFLSAVSKERKIRFLFAGHYPLPSKENKIIEKLSSSYPTSSISFYSSINDAAFEPFGADRIAALLSQLGLKEDECIEHIMVSKAMARAREKIESKVHHEIVAKSESEWFITNVKNSK
jgi:preprotein translocase subunit SecA